MRRGAFVAWLLLAASAVPAGAAAGEDEVHRLPSGREVLLDRGRLRPRDAAPILEEARGLLKAGRLDLALAECQFVRGRGEGDPVAEAASLAARIGEVERSSLIVLKDGASYRGTLRAKLRADHLGLQGRDEIPLWRIERIEAEYLINYSQVTRTFYLVTLLDIAFRDAPPTKATMTEEIVLELEEQDGNVRKIPLGCAYELLRKEQMGESVPELIRQRAWRVIVYSALQENGPPPPEEAR